MSFINFFNGPTLSDQLEMSALEEAEEIKSQKSDKEYNSFYHQTKYQILAEQLENTYPKGALFDEMLEAAIKEYMESKDLDFNDINTKTHLMDQAKSYFGAKRIAKKQKEEKKDESLKYVKKSAFETAREKKYTGTYFDDCKGGKNPSTEMTNPSLYRDLAKINRGDPDDKQQENQNKSVEDRLTNEPKNPLTTVDIQK